MSFLGQQLQIVRKVVKIKVLKKKKKKKGYPQRCLGYQSIIIPLRSWIITVDSQLSLLIGVVHLDVRIIRVSQLMIAGNGTAIKRCVPIYVSEKTYMYVKRNRVCENCSSLMIYLFFYWQKKKEEEKIHKQLNFISMMRKIVYLYKRITQHYRLVKLNWFNWP